MDQGKQNQEHPSVFGRDAQQLDQLLSLGLDETEPEEEPLWPGVYVDGCADTPGTRIGRYKLIRILGEGGMGIVHLAEQERPIRRQVALKIIKPGMDTKQVIAHFEAERQVLAFFDHPNIAHVHDAGMTQQGRPFFVMEYVEGMPITDYCDEHTLSIEARLRLFLQVCEAVHHAHQKGIIHRDIKPSNILISDQDGRPLPKIIDFGVAKAIGKSLGDYSLHTEAGQLLGTPEYMSPEQADMANEDIDIRADVYSLGVLLYFLLVGRLPFDTQKLRAHGIEHIRQVIREQEPETLGTRLTALDAADEGHRIALIRHTDIRTLLKTLRTELEWIPLMAMRKERERRYQSAVELAQDVRNYLNGEPLQAGPPGSTYRVHKFVRRNKTLVVAGLLLLVTLIGATLVSTLFAIQAQRETKNAAALNTFFNKNLLESLNPLKNSADEVSAVSILNRASENLKDQFRDEPLVEASIRQTLASAYTELAALDSAQTHQTLALQLRRKCLGDQHPDTLDSMYAAAVLYREQSRYVDAVQIGQQALAGQKRVLGPDHTRTLLTMNILGVSYRNQGNLNKAETLLKEAEGIADRALGEEDKYTLFIKVSLAGVYRDQGLFEKAETLLESILPAYKHLWGEEHPHTLDLMRVLGMLYSRHKDPGDAEDIFSRELEIRRRVLGEEHLQTLSTMRSLAKLYTQQGHYPEANDLAVRALEIGLRKYGEDHPTTLWSGNRLAVLRTAQKQYAEAEILLTRVIEGWTRTSEEGHPNTLRAKRRLSRVYMPQDRYHEATPLLLDAFEGLFDKLGPNHPDTLDSENDLGALYKKLGRFADAQPLLLKAWEGRCLKFGEDHPDTIASLNNLITLYKSWKKPEEVTRWRAKLPRAEEM
jgi:eukaryotic-like serine/threonine-protein kinase